MRELAIAKEHDGTQAGRDRAVEWCRKGIELAIYRDRLSEGVDYSWGDLRVVDRSGSVVELRLPIYG